MMTRGSAALRAVVPEADREIPEDVVWIDIEDPTPEERQALESLLAIQLPTREEMHSIEISARLYAEDDAHFMTAVLLTRIEEDLPGLMPLAFILTQGHLVTLHFEPTRMIGSFVQQAKRQVSQTRSPATVLLGLLEIIIDRVSDALEHTASAVEQDSAEIFQRGRRDGFEPIVRHLGQSQRVCAKARESLVSLSRLCGFASLAPAVRGDPVAPTHMLTLQRDTEALTDHASYLSSNITFLLDAALGLINIEQNAIIKIFSVASVVFLPPTLVASIYGMNFEHMPELRWLQGYPLALGLMVVSMLVPLWWFRRKGWL